MKKKKIVIVGLIAIVLIFYYILTKYFAINSMKGKVMAFYNSKIKSKMESYDLMTKTSRFESPLEKEVALSDLEARIRRWIEIKAYVKNRQEQTEYICVAPGIIYIKHHYDTGEGGRGEYAFYFWYFWGATKVYTTKAWIR